MAYGMEERANSPVIGWARIATGLVQGVGLWALTQAAEHKLWPATSGALFGALAAIVLFTPFVVLAGLAEMRRRNVVIWALAVAVVMGLLGLHDITRQATLTSIDWLSPQMMVFTAAGLFIGHHLLEAGDLDDRLIARYPTYFDLAWKHGVQMAMSAGFVGVFWIVLMLGGALFKLIGIDFVEMLIRKPWFAFPATTTMFAAAVQLTDVRHTLIRGVRTVALTLLSWLSPVLVFLAAAFMASLPFTGLEVLWKTKSAAAILLSAAAVMVILINAAYQDGVPDTPTPLVLRWAGRIGGLLLAPLVGVAAYALWLRIGQYGLTPDRIIAAACVIVGACYAVGYGVAAVLPGMWMKALELTNVVTAFVVLGLLLAIFSPLADPARLAVNDQMARLAAGKITADKVDYRFLRFDGEKYGKAALQALVRKGGEAGKRAAEVLKAENRWTSAKPTTRISADRIKVWPKGRTLPQSLLEQEWPEPNLSPPGGRPGFEECAGGQEGCDAFIIDLDRDGREEVLISKVRGRVDLFAQNADRSWSHVGLFQTQGCPGLRDSLVSGKYKLGASRWPSIEADGDRYVFTELTPVCKGAYRY